ncbi:cytochrome c oxidase assembly protein [Kocuria sediminis]|uniref:Cytochrome c oxidase assembly protein n=1 Tax=Kocuria sediminis TaxID=1038857 RepID=A0A6N8GP46_9MICC|nr:cytochrome c oxidase assembly protein [Kocuria sediminis]MUN64851.1 cytochrome c oxidase assembly protein [Kocuria sediminis]
MVLGLAAVGYVAGLWASRSHGRWPIHRTVLWYAGVFCAGAGLVGPVAEAARTNFSAHMVGHLLLGMIGPLCLSLSAPVTLALRALPVAKARKLSRLLRTVLVRGLTHPVVTVVLNAGGLWALYTTDLYHLMHTSVWLHALIHTHVLVAGYLFTIAIVGIDPNPHRSSFPLRATALIGFLTVHSILAKWLYGHPPSGVESTDARTGAQIMYYGGDAVDVTLIIVFCAQWYSATRPRGIPQSGARASR